MTDAVLEALLDDIESDRAERNESASDGDKPSQAVCTLGAHTYAVADAYTDFKNVAAKIAANAELPAVT